VHKAEISFYFSVSIQNSWCVDKGEEQITYKYYIYCIYYKIHTSICIYIYIYIYIYMCVCMCVCEKLCYILCDTQSLGTLFCPTHIHIRANVSCVIMIVLYSI